MKKVVLLLVITIVVTVDAYSTDESWVCKHVGKIYAYSSLGQGCPLYEGGKPGILPGYIHLHDGQNQYARSVRISDGYVIEENPGHCTITKSFTSQQIF